MPRMLVRPVRCTQGGYDYRAQLRRNPNAHHLRYSSPGDSARIIESPSRGPRERRPMKPWLQRTAVSAVALAFLPLIELASPAVGRAQPPPPPPPCPPGMFWNFATVRCEFPLPPPVYVDPWLPIWVPDIVDVDLDVDIPVGPPGIGAPGPPGGIGGPGGPNIGRPGPPPLPRGGLGGGRRGGRR
jgi:hypothetical protein